MAALTVQQITSQQISASVAQANNTQREDLKGIKVWRATENSDAFISATTAEINVAGNAKNWINVGSHGITMRGNISHICMGEGQRTGGLFVNANEFINMIPKSIVTPFPMILPIPPFGLAGSIVGGLAMVIALMVV
jgi:hypothetical protein